MKYKDRFVEACKHVDVMQIMLNRSLPCYHLQDDNRFCGRAEYWAGHEEGNFHKFVSLSDAVSNLLEDHV